MGITVDVKNAQKLIIKAKKAFADFKKPLRDTSKYQLDQIEKQFATEGSQINGSKWKALSAATIKQRIRAGYGPGPILTRSGKMRKSNSVERLTQNELVIGNKVYYFQYHQSPGKNQRRVYAHSQKMIKDVVRIFENYLKKALNG